MRGFSQIHLIWLGFALADNHAANQDANDATAQGRKLRLVAYDQGSE